MKCTIVTGDSFYREGAQRLFVAGKLCKDGSIFQRRLLAGDPLDGFVALVEDFGEVIGWARTEPWVETTEDGIAAGFGHAVLHWNTLEAFVARDYRGRGVATFAAAGLAATAFQGEPTAAVFHPHMMLLARRVGLMPTLFREERKSWVRA